ncbi:signal peptidase II [soil metagenome]
MRESSTANVKSPWRLFVGTVIVVILADVLSKMVITALLGPGSDRPNIQVLSTAIQFTYAENGGIAFGLLRGDSGIVWGLVLLATLGMMVIVWATISSATRQMGLAMGFVAGGGLANLADRIADGQVVDFISLWRWPSFNVADACITVGVIALLVLLLRHEPA